MFVEVCFKFLAMRSFCSLFRCGVSTVRYLTPCLFKGIFKSIPKTTSFEEKGERFKSVFLFHQFVKKVNVQVTSDKYPTGYQQAGSTFCPPEFTKKKEQYSYHKAIPPLYTEVIEKKLRNTPFQLTASFWKCLKIT